MMLLPASCLLLLCYCLVVTRYNVDDRDADVLSKTCRLGEVTVRHMTLNSCGYIVSSGQRTYAVFIRCLS
jgi:hypothetical protein